MSTAALAARPTPGFDADDLHFSVGRSSLGFVLVAHSPSGIRAVLLGDSVAELQRDLRRRFPGTATAAGRADILEAVVARIEDPTGTDDLPLDLSGTAFQLAVWRALRDVPAGATATYSELARRIGRPEAVRAVGGAVAANPVAVLVPCHRVIRSDGSLSGYRWGVERKRALLAREGAAAGQPRWLHAASPGSRRPSAGAIIE